MATRYQLASRLLDKEVRDKYVSNVMAYHAKGDSYIYEHITYPDEFIAGGFVWDLTPEGHEYWKEHSERNYDTALYLIKNLSTKTYFDFMKENLTSEEFEFYIQNVESYWKKSSMLFLSSEYRSGAGYILADSFPWRWGKGPDPILGNEEYWKNINERIFEGKNEIVDPLADFKEKYVVYNLTGQNYVLGAGKYQLIHSSTELNVSSNIVLASGQKFDLEDYVKNLVGTLNYLYVIRTDVSPRVIIFSVYPK